MHLLLERDHECYYYLVKDLPSCHCWTSVLALYRAFWWCLFFFSFEQFAELVLKNFFL